MGSRWEYERLSRETLLEGVATLEQTNASLARSSQVALETEQLGTEVISDLGTQRETLLRAKSRLTQADEGLRQSRSLLKKMANNILYNKIILIVIILLEIAILITLVYHRFFQNS